MVHRGYRQSGQILLKDLIQTFSKSLVARCDGGKGGDTGQGRDAAAWRCFHIMLLQAGWYFADLLTCGPKDRSGRFLVRSWLSGMMPLNSL